MPDGPESHPGNGTSGANGSHSDAGENGRVVPVRRRRSAADVLRTRIYTERKARGWPARKMAEVLRGLADAPDRLPSVCSLIRMIRGWEAGKHVPSELYRLLYCKSFAMTEDELFGDRSELLITQPTVDKGTCRPPVEGALWGYATTGEPAPERTGPVSLVISLSLPYVPGRLVIDMSGSYMEDRDVSDRMHPGGHHRAAEAGTSEVPAE
jgi:transcriptional regulator with XRE-family HTH domain